MTTQHFKLQNVSCSSCVMHLEGMEDDLEGVKKVDVNFRQLTMKVEYLEEKIGVDGITKAVADMGYVAAPAELTEINDQKISLWSNLFRS